ILTSKTTTRHPSLQVVNLERKRVVSLERNAMVSFQRKRVISLNGMSTNPGKLNCYSTFHLFIFNADSSKKQLRQSIILF
ncbi:MAG TPA: hypothetical protein VMR70_09080, partial [Flavisolibacter sp.]|nr:hypothetical protein [Flavisolibacter sp.]